MEDNANFYRDKTWELVMNEIQDVKKELHETNKKLDQLNDRMKYIFGFAAAIGLSANFIWQWILGKIQAR